MPFTNYFKSCDDLFTRWHTNSAKTFSISFYSVLGGDKLILNGMPEPFIGNPEKCSSVLVNINPGGVIAGYNDKGGILESNCHEYGYSRIMKCFPSIVDLCSLSTGGRVFWQLRVKWIDRIVSKWMKHPAYKGLPTSYIKDRLPFGIEICPWHSKYAPNISKEELKKNPPLLAEINNVLSVAAKAIGNSLLPCGIVIGQVGYDALLELGYTVVYKPAVMPPISNRDLVLVEKDDVKFLCVLSPKGGSNKPPQKGFDDIVLDIFAHC